MSEPCVLLIEGSDFDTFPAGGQLTMARSLMKIFGDRLALVGIARDGSPAGRWMIKRINGIPYAFLPVCHREPSARRPLVPARLKFYAGLRRYREQILSLGCRAAFLQAPEALLAVSRWEWESLCFWFAGAENPLRISRYALARPLSGLFDRSLFAALDRVDVVLAAADQSAIDALVSRSGGRLRRDRLEQVPTCVDTSEFHAMPIRAVRAELGIPAEIPVFVTSGRISRFKGWELLLESFGTFRRAHSDSQLIFVGDGEDRTALQAAIRARSLGASVKITGFQQPRRVAAYLNAADVVVFCSYVEGWSAAMLEALACGKPIVSTDVSGVSAMIAPGQNGFIVKSRNPAEFAGAMKSALFLRNAGQVSAAIASEYDLPHLGDRLGRLWAPFLNIQAGSNQERAFHAGS